MIFEEKHDVRCSWGLFEILWLQLQAISWLTFLIKWLKSNKINWNQIESCSFTQDTTQRWWMWFELSISRHKRRGSPTSLRRYTLNYMRILGWQMIWKWRWGSLTISFNSILKRFPLLKIVLNRHLFVFWNEYFW